MRTYDDIDPALFGVPVSRPYDGFACFGCPQEESAETAALLLDLKSEAEGDPLDEMQAMLTEMTKELRERFQRFQSQRRTAEQAAGAAADETDGKLAQADAKAAIEAVSLIVRTLEKIDSLQRAILSERRDADERCGEDEDFEAVAAEFERRVKAKAQAWFEKWKADYVASAGRATLPAGLRGSIRARNSASHT